MLRLDLEKNEVGYSFESREDLIVQLGVLMDAIVKDLVVDDTDGMDLDTLKSTILAERCNLLVDLIREDCFLSDEALLYRHENQSDEDGDKKSFAENVVYTKN